MNKCVDSTCCRHRCRRRCQKFRIQYRIRRKKFITEYCQFIISAVICDNRKRRDLRTGACCRRDCNEWDDFSGYFMCPFIFCNTATVFCSYTDCLGNIHRRAAAQCHNKICPGFFKCSCCFFYSRYGRVCFYFRKNIHLHAGIFEIFCCFVHNSHLTKCRS